MLTGKQRSYLKSLAMQLDAAVFIGRAELSDNVIAEMDNYLEAHELLKVKLQEGCLLDPKAAANEAAERLGAEFVQAIGRKFVLYRPAKEKVIILPR
ncbi:MAG: YhbY family RNA-binding protein [Firmicutes bacterium]|nr:YhbY family RNA-binding protein [Bacillota bacterium]